MSPMLSLENVIAGYGDAVVLDDISFSMAQGSALAVLGRNGAGKTTLCETLMGLTSFHGGSIVWKGDSVHGVPAHRRARLGFGYVPQQREIFSSLTVLENLAVFARPGGWAINAVFELFPSLRERRANAGNQMSGGEQQMLAMGRALVGNPRLLILDEPLEGLAPQVVEELLDNLRRIRQQAELSMIVVEQKAELALALCDRAIVLDRGKIAYDGASAELKVDGEKQDRLLGVGIKRRDPRAAGIVSQATVS